MSSMVIMVQVGLSGSNSMMIEKGYVYCTGYNSKPLQRAKSRKRHESEADANSPSILQHDVS